MKKRSKTVYFLLSFAALASQHWAVCAQGRSGLLYDQLGMGAPTAEEAESETNDQRSVFSFRPRAGHEVVVSMPLPRRDQVLDEAQSTDPFDYGAAQIRATGTLPGEEVEIGLWGTR